jgi:uncharacterized protein
MEQLDLAGMFILGVLGSGHCLGMCGPLVLAFPGRSGRFLPHVWYQFGRVTTYAVVGAALGGSGMVLAAVAGVHGRADLAPFQGAVRLAAAGVLAALGLMRLGWLGEPRWFAALGPEKIPGFGRVLGTTAAGTSALGHSVTGAVLGLLPCGLSYGAFAQALGTGSAGHGALTGLAFGLGTVPGLLLLGTGLATLVRRYRRASDLLAGALMLVMAVNLAVKAFRA